MTYIIGIFRDGKLIELVRSVKTNGESLFVEWFLEYLVSKLDRRIGYKIPKGYYVAWDKVR